MRPSPALAQSNHLPSTRPYTRNSYRLYARFRVLAPLPGRYLCFRHELFERVRVQEAEVDRLYSRFPVGSVGLALLLLRLVDGLGLVGEGIHLFALAGSSLEPKSVLLLGLVLVASAIL